jgi:hypothetical protein
MDVEDEVTDGSPKEGSPTDAGDAGDGGDATPNVPSGSGGPLAVGCLVEDQDANLPSSQYCYGYANPYPINQSEFNSVCAAGGNGATGTPVTTCPSANLVGCCSGPISGDSITLHAVSCFYKNYTVDQVLAQCAQLSDASTFQTSFP